MYIKHRYGIGILLSVAIPPIVRLFKQPQLYSSGDAAGNDERIADDGAA